MERKVMNGIEREMTIGIERKVTNVKIRIKK
jgi:hypothetical protein